MEQSYARLACLIQEKASTSEHGRIIVGISGPPGSGKSTVATHVAAIFNSLPGDNVTSDAGLAQSYAVAVSIDGFHLSRAQLAAMPNVEEAFARRGALWTFDADGVLKFVQLLKSSCLQPASRRPIILAPSFDHALKDPIPDSLQINPEAAIILLEHNYLLLNRGTWAAISELLDFRIFIHVDEMEAQDRVAKRHLLSGIETTMEAAVTRFQNNDAMNGRLIRENITAVDAEVWSV